MRVFVGAAIILIVGLFLANLAMRRPASGAQTVPAGMLPDDAVHIPKVDHWRLAQSEDFDPQGVVWLQGKGKEVNGHILGRFAGEGLPEESAYVLISDDGRQPAQVRVVLIVNQVARFDRIYPSIAVVTVVRKSDLDAIAWQGAPPLTPADGDGILIVPKYDDPKSASIAYVCREVLTAGTPADFHALSLQ